jgi:GTP-binding protein
VFLVDVRHEPGQGDLMLRRFLDHHALPHVLVATKADKLGRGEVKRRQRALADGLGSAARAVMLASARTRIGIDELWREIRQAAAERREGAA